MVFNKVSMVLLLLSVVATLADARVDHFEALPKFESAGERPKFCSTCECKEESGTTKCRRYDRKVGGCPLVCGSQCACTLPEPPEFAICVCSYAVDTCDPTPCPKNSASKLENLLKLN